MDKSVEVYSLTINKLFAFTRKQMQKYIKSAASFALDRNVYVEEQNKSKWEAHATVTPVEARQVSDPLHCSMKPAP